MVHGETAGALVQEHAVEREQRRPVGESAHRVQIPELVEGGPWHSGGNIKMSYEYNIMPSTEHRVTSLKADVC